jgi:hypothetical protein
VSDVWLNRNGDMVLVFVLVAQTLLSGHITNQRENSHYQLSLCPPIETLSNMSDRLPLFHIPAKN